MFKKEIYGKNNTRSLKRGDSIVFLYTDFFIYIINRNTFAFNIKNRNKRFKNIN